MCLNERGNSWDRNEGHLDFVLRPLIDPPPWQLSLDCSQLPWCLVTKFAFIATKLFTHMLYYSLLTHRFFPPGIPTDEEQATGLERRTLQALKQGKVSFWSIIFWYRSSQNFAMAHQKALTSWLGPFTTTTTFRMFLLTITLIIIYSFFFLIKKIHFFAFYGISLAANQKNSIKNSIKIFFS